jgi:hypothetical protein
MRHLSVVRFEFERIARAVLALPEDDREALRRRLESGREDPRCVLLDDEGRCRVYEARPLICRSHGLPIRVGSPPRRDVCSLNFTEGPSVQDLAEDVVLDAERLALVLGIIDRLASGPDAPRVGLLDGLKLLISRG